VKPLDARILDLYESLTPQERRLANVVLEHQRDFASYSATELARRADVSKATAARLFRRLGYGSFDEARRQARSLRHWGSPLNIFEHVDKGDGTTQSPLVHVQSDIANITRTFEALDPGAIGQAADLLAGAQRIWVIGFRASQPLAGLLCYWLSVVRPDVRLFQSGGMVFAESAIDMLPGDVAVAVGFRRRTRMLRALVERARSVNVKVILIADVSASTTAKLADIVLRCHTRPSYLFDSYAAVLSVMNYLTAAVALRLGEGTLQRMSQIDTLHDALDAFTAPPRRR
jgi:DNA-binding MurR/RpiR family transcriptional regulator